MNRPLARIRCAVTGAIVAAVLAVAAAALARLAVALRRSREQARDVPLSPVKAGQYVGPGFAEREGLTTGGEPAGEVADVAHFAGEAFDPDRLDPEVRRFYERTADYGMRYRARWHRPFRTGAALASLLTGRIEQLNLPGPGDESWHRLESRFLDVEEPGAVAVGDDPTEPAREDVRAWVRTDPETGEAVFVALYATHHRDGEGFVNISVPIPGGGVDTVLRPENLEPDAEREDRTGIRLATDAVGDPGLYLRTPVGAFAVPGGQRFEVWPPVDDDEPLRATHEMWLLGRPFLTVEYEIERA
ncbi:MULTISPECIES: hypothetical protein [Halolamina]|uniref:Uncharacterized protein n=1 Tax=Halolamina pelagica TaxID=699431 RepID=A0A1I5SCZ3_9EURY|nr:MULTISPECIES: hypothetical protein [Halolamina]NHX37117.1 hypothetical protein [Halolamina sp. R1-12]SFP68590.1 hypothetical protein SAMN05216277_10660 [Halolamina pelagica]